MNCLTADSIYLFLEGDLSPAEASQARTHCARCATCRDAVAERRQLNRAARNLAAWPVPQNFSRQIMARIFPERLSLRRALGTAAAGTAGIVSALALVFLLSGLSLLNFLMSLNQSILGGLRDLALYGAKLIKLLTLLAKVFSRFTGFVWDNLAHLSGLPSPHLQAALIGITVLITLSLYFGVKRLLPAGEKS